MCPRAQGRATNWDARRSSARSGQERADVLADAARDLDVEAGLRGHVEALSRRVLAGLRRAVDLDAAQARDDLHALRGVGAEVELAGIDEAERRLLAAGEEDRMADHASLEVDVGLRDGGDVLETLGC